MRNSSNKWNSYFTYSLLPMLFIGCDFHILATNEAMRKKIGYNKDDLLSMNFTELLVEDVKDQFEKLIFEDQYYSFLIKLHVFSKDHDMFYVTASVNNFFSLAGHYEESLIVLNPLSQNYSLKQSLLESLMNPSIKN